MSKTIRNLLMMCAAALVLSACSSSSTQDTASTADPATTSGSSSSTVSTSTKAPKPLATVFYFDFDSSTLRADSKALLKAHAAAIKAKPRAVRLEGHADERGTREYNIALGERRAQAVRAYLISQGVTSSIDVVSYGEERPAVNQSNDYAWQQNRRVEIK